ncbi:unnamed protein product, partial [Iphiclides podalirius]
MVEIADAKRPREASHSRLATHRHGDGSTELRHDRNAPTEPCPTQLRRYEATPPARITPPGLYGTSPATALPTLCEVYEFATQTRASLS